MHNAFFEGAWTQYKESEDYINTVLVLVCVICAGLASGLTLGLLSLDATKLEIKALTGTEEEGAAAVSLLPIVQRHHQLLVTLLLFNSIANGKLKNGI